MKRYLSFMVIVLSVHLFCLQAVATPGLKIEQANEEEIKGSYRVLLYGARHGNDLETIAFLDPLEDGFEVELYTPDFNYRVEDKRDAKEAIKIASTFVSWHSSYRSYSLGKILNADGKVLAYEVRPLYMPLEYGVSDVFDNSYWLRGNRVVIKVRLIAPVERLIYDFDTPRQDN